MSVLSQRKQNLEGAVLAHMNSIARVWFGRVLPILLFAALNLGVLKLQTRLDDDRRQNLLERNRTNLPHEIRYDESVGENLDLYWRHIPDSRTSRLIVLSGMSQMYAINDRQAGDETIAEVLDDELRQEHVRVFGLAAPNMNNEEALLLFLAAATDVRTKPTVWIYGICFDKFRNVDVRPGMLRFLSHNEDLAREWQIVAERVAARMPSVTEHMKRALDEARRAAHPAQGHVSFEDHVRAIAARILPLVRARTEINAWLQLRLFVLRNAVFRIKPTSKRPMINERYTLNWEFLDLLREEAGRRGVLLVTYVIPLNPQGDNPYIPAEYETFKQRMATWCVTNRVTCANFESVVPAQHWGEFMGGPDFKHFRGVGHRITAGAILRTFGRELKGKP